MATTLSGRVASQPAQRSAASFFWCWMGVATSMSVCGNVAHALLTAPAGHRWMAAVAALVPPIVLIAGNHSMAVLVRTRAGGGVYWVALLATVLLALGAFVLSFDALRSLAIAVGIRASMAWIWPAVIDVAIAQATLCLLSLTRGPRTRAADAASAGEDDADAPTLEAGSDLGSRSVLFGADDNDTAGPLRAAEGDLMGRVLLTRLADGGGDDDMLATTQGLEAVTGSAPVGERALAAMREAPTRRVGRSGSLDAAAVRRWQPVAESLVRDGVTTKEPELVATILAEREAGTRPGTIERQHKVHHSVVRRVWAAADERTG